MSLTLEIDVVDNEVNINVIDETVEIQFFDAVLFDSLAFEFWLLSLNEYPNEAEALADLGPNKLYWISAGTDTEFPNTLKKTPSL